MSIPQQKTFGTNKYVKTNREGELIDPKVRGKKFQVFAQQSGITTTITANQLLSDLVLNGASAAAITGPTAQETMAALGINWNNEPDDGWKVLITNSDVASKQINFPSGYTPAFVVIPANTTIEFAWKMTSRSPAAVSLVTQLNSSTGGGVGVTTFNGRNGAVVSVAGDYNGTQVTNTPFGIVTAVTTQAAINQLATQAVVPKVDAFNGRTGLVLPLANDYTGAQVVNVPFGSIASTNVQAAINELATDAAVPKVDAFNGRTGLVLPLANDYTGAQVVNVPFGSIASTNVQAAINELAADAAVPKVDSFNTRTGAVTAAFGDYNASQITSAPALPTVPGTDVQTAINQLAAASVVPKVNSFNGRTGVVVPLANDYTGSQVTNVPAGNISAVTTQAAINELDAEKQPLIPGIIAGDTPIFNGTSYVIALGSNITSKLQGIITFNPPTDATILPFFAHNKYIRRASPNVAQVHNYVESDGVSTPVGAAFTNNLTVATGTMGNRGFPDINNFSTYDAVGGTAVEPATPINPTSLQPGLYQYVAGTSAGTNNTWFVTRDGRMRVSTLIGVPGTTVTRDPVSGMLSNTVSSIRYKEEINDLTDCDWVENLPTEVEYQLKSDSTHDKFLGYIAEYINDNTSLSADVKKKILNYDMIFPETGAPYYDYTSPNNVKYAGLQCAFNFYFRQKILAQKAQILALQTQANAQAALITSLQATVATHTSDIAELKLTVAGLLP